MATIIGHMADLTSAAAVAHALGGKRVFSKEVRSADALREAVHRGLKYAAFEELRDRLGVPQSELASVLRIAPRTMGRRKDEGRFHEDESDRLLRIGRITALAESTLGSPEKASRWLSAANLALGGDAPLKRAATDVGAREVEDILLKIAHGVYS
jgi:putative toxin-antitoxin system antitoxin component (TIGR02293 family)